MEWYIKAGALVFTALILVPYLYRKLRPDEPAILEGDYRVEVSHESRKFGELDSSDLPGADMPVFGGSMSTPGRYLDMETQKEWLHPDILRYRDTLKEKTGARKMRPNRLKFFVFSVFSPSCGLFPPFL